MLPKKIMKGLKVLKCTLLLFENASKHIVRTKYTGPPPGGQVQVESLDLGDCEGRTSIQKRIHVLEVPLEVELLPLETSTNQNKCP